MRQVPTRSARINTIWNSGDFTGDQRPAGRVTIQKVAVKHHHTFHREYRSVLFGQPYGEVELTTVESIEITRSTSTDAATCEVVLTNGKALGVGEGVGEDEIDSRGWLTFSRGSGPGNDRWNYDENEWHQFIVPDRFLRTYQGYGEDLSVAPADDTNLLRTGTWLIDDVTIQTDGTMRVSCRDLTALLLDQHIYPPVVPPQHYPLVFQPYPDVSTHPATQTPTRINVGGNYRDYTDIVKQLACIGGFYWPIAYSGTTDPALFEASGRCWGDFEQSGTFAVNGIPTSVFDKQPIMDGITYVKEILGFVYFVDEDGGIIFRSQNIWSKGCYVTGAAYGTRGRTDDVLTIDERYQLLNYNIQLTNTNKRALITVGTSDGKYRAQVTQNETIPADQRPLTLERHAIWTDQHFASSEECNTMADFIKVALAQQYRVGHPSIPANPNLQIDDQVRIIERQTAEGYLHYVAGYKSSWSRDSGEYTMDLDTYWLGEDFGGSYFTTSSDLSAATITLLQSRSALPVTAPTYYVTPSAASALAAVDGNYLTVTSPQVVSLPEVNQP